MESAVTKAQSLSRPGDVVLLSPACASFDMYAGFEARGEAFVNAVNKLHNGGAA
jgi:UDP-N-acetylmuramoylalanine--D-glutamate ligase